MDTSGIAIFWFRRDLRLHDNAGLYYALRSGFKVLPLFIFDSAILDKLEDRDDPRITFIHQTIHSLSQQLQSLGSSLLVKYGTPLEVWKELLTTYPVKQVFTNHDYEPYARDRDQAISEFLQAHQISFHTYKDQTIFEKGEILKDDGKPYTVFTPYSRKWRAALSEFYLRSYPTESYFDAFQASEPLPIPSLEQMGFTLSALAFPNQQTTQKTIKEYQVQRNFPSVEGTSRLSLHFRFGTISIREKARKALSLSDTWVNELIWRDFYMMILWHFPQVEKQSFKPRYDQIDWRNNQDEFEKWCVGKTGYPIVDAGMRELNTTGHMHNRVRMITASFLTKHLLIDWRWGEAYFARKLLDFDLSANNGGWQWASGSGTDAAPYFRIFNPTAQLEKFDKNLAYIQKWVPEYGTDAYPKPIVDHKFARERCLKAYKAALG